MPKVGGKCPQWTGPELKICREIKARGREMTIKECAHLLPGRTLTAIRQQVARQPGGKKTRGRASWVWPAIQRLLEETPGLTNRELSEAIGCTRNGVQYATDHAVSQKKMHVCGWSGNAPKYALGDKPNVAKPTRQSREASYAIQKAKRRAKRNPFEVAMRQITAEAGEYAGA